MHNLLLLLVTLGSLHCAARPVPDGWVDRIEGDVAVVIEDIGGGYVAHDVPLAWLPAGVSEGDVLTDGRIDEAARLRRLRRIRELQRALFGEPR